MHHLQKKLGFTLVELIVATSILAILSTIGFYSYTSSIGNARDSVRQTDISKMTSELTLYKRERGSYPLAGDAFEIRNGPNVVVANQGFMNNKVLLSTAQTLSRDPELDIPYSYSTTRNRQEYQLGATLENGGSPYAIVKGDYRSVAVNVLPTILLARSGTSFVNIQDSNIQELFIFHKSSHNLPYDSTTGIPYSGGGKNLSTLIIEAADDYWQNSDYRNCDEINNAGKNITETGFNDFYQIVNTSGQLVNQQCDGIL